MKNTSDAAYKSVLFVTVVLQLLGSAFAATAQYDPERAHDRSDAMPVNGHASESDPNARGKVVARLPSAHVDRLAHPPVEIRRGSS